MQFHTLTPMLENLQGIQIPSHRIRRESEKEMCCSTSIRWSIPQLEHFSGIRVASFKAAALQR